ncbi:MAG: D-2-hydroxyacid dehydrogenase [Treponema sp.]|jgi:phosphoglycerate dehydrogenase-like enzyme|nr:D-2-hydroxyacid dehydrogenase [Treponema sp.]
MENQKTVILLSLPQNRLLPEFREELLAAGVGREVLITMDQAEIELYLDRIEIGMGDLPFTLLPKMSNLKWLQLWSAGADFLQRFPEAKTLPFQLTITTGIHQQQLTEHLFAMLLGWNRCLPEAFAAQRRHEWLFITDRRLTALKGKTMLILGYGTIGETIARIAQSFGMTVLGVCRNPAGKPGLNAGAGPRVEPAAKLRELLPEADHVVNILPSTAATRSFFGAAEFGLMKQSALYINIGRGATTDEAAMIEALRSKRIAGALLDVVETEPLPPDSPLWDMDNVILTGHFAGCHPDYSRMAMDVALDNLGRYNRGESLKNQVDKELGY